MSGTVAAVGAGATRWRVGDRVCALLAGGGYAELVAVDERHVLPVPDGLDLVEAAGLPEVVATVWSNVVLDAGLAPGETLLVHGGSSGIGTMAIQLAARLGARVAVTAGSPAKLEACRALGADILIDYRQQDFVQALLGPPTGTAPTSCSTRSAATTSTATSAPSRATAGSWSSARRAARPRASRSAS